MQLLAKGAFLPVAGAEKAHGGIAAGKEPQRLLLAVLDQLEIGGVEIRQEVAAPVRDGPRTRVESKSTRR